MACCSVKAQISPIPLPYAFDALEPIIDTQTMRFHYGTHYSAYVNNTNNSTASAPALKGKGITDLVLLVGSPPAGVPPATMRTIRNNAGGAWNHALFWKVMAPPTSAAAKETSISKELGTAIKQSFGSLAAVKTEMSSNATKVFGSGWSWLCYNAGTPSKPLVITSTPNQDNPLMGSLPNSVTAPGCVPILGLDVWEHAYYLKHGPKRAKYVEDWWKVVNWSQVSKNLESAKAKKFAEIGQ